MRVASQGIALSRDFAIPVVAGAVLGLAVIESPLAAICAIVGGFVAISMGRDPIKALGALILVLPFLGTYWLSQNLTSLPGTKPYQLLAVLVAAAAIWNLYRAHRLPRYVLFFTVLFLVYFTVCVLRALPHLEHLGIKGDEAPTAGKFLLSNFIKPIIFFLPFVIITVYCRTVKDIDLVIRFVVIATVGLAICLLYIYAKDARGLNVREASDVYHGYLGYHRNALGSLLMVSFPFLLARLSIRKSIFNVAAFFVTIAATCILFSRTAYVTLALAPVIYAIISKRFKVIPVVLGIFVVIIVLTPSIVRERASAGLDSNDVNEIFAGRVDQVWLPIIEEYLVSPIKLFFGRGRFAIASTEASLRGHILEVKSSHSMYVEQVMDGGLLGLFFMFAFLASVFGRFVKTLGQSEDLRVREYGYAVAVSAACYLAGGFSGRSMFPMGESSFFWIMMAIAIVIPLVDHSAERQAVEGALAPAHRRASEQK